MGHFFLAFGIQICSSELTPHEQRDKVIFLVPDICTQKEIFLNHNFFPGFEGTHRCSICKYTPKQARPKLTKHLTQGGCMLQPRLS